MGHVNARWCFPLAHKCVCVCVRVCHPAGSNTVDFLWEVHDDCVALVYSHACVCVCVRVCHSAGSDTVDFLEEVRDDCVARQAELDTLITAANDLVALLFNLTSYRSTVSAHTDTHRHTHTHAHAHTSLQATSATFNGAPPFKGACVCVMATCEDHAMMSVCVCVCYMCVGVVSDYGGCECDLPASLLVVWHM